TLTAGNNLSIQATGSGVKGVDGDLTIQGSQIKAGNNVLLQANRDVNLVSAENTSKLEGKNTSSGGSVGVGIGVGSGGWGISVSASAHQGKGSEKGNGTTHTETTVDAGNRLTIISGRDTTLTGAQAGGETVKVDAGRHLTLTSEQDSDRYDSKQQNASAGGSFTFGSMSGSASVSLSRDKMHSNYDSVQEQTGIFAGRGGFDVTTGQHTQLNGAVIASTATADKNRLDTGTLGFSDIDNRADFKTEHQSTGLSTGGSVAGNFLGNMANNLLVGANHEGHADSTTQSAVSAGNITIRDTQSQKQDVADLKRDAAHANQTLSPIFDREKEQQRLQQAQLIGEIGNQVADIARTEGQIAGEKAKRDPAALNQARAELEAAGKPFTEQDVAQRAYNKGMAASGFGTGGKYQQAIQAATAAVQGLAGGNLSAALAGGAAPYIAEIIKQTTPDGAGRVAAHAVVNAALAVAQGNNALAGAAGAATGEVVGMIATQMYGKPVSELSEAEKQTVSTLATVAAGLAGGLVGDSGASAVAGAQSGKTTVENNLLGGSELLQTEKAKEHGADVLSCSENPSGEACKRGQAENKAYAAALATGSVALLPGSAQAMWLLGAGTNAGMQYADSGEINPVNSVAAGWINVITMGQGWKGTIAWNAAGGALTNAINGDDPLTGSITNGAGAGFGYGVGNYVVKPVANTAGKWITGGWNPKFDPTLLKYTEVKGQLGISKEMVPSKIPGAAGNMGASITSEMTGTELQKVINDKLKKGERE
ncbi:hemagglutinin repeat-containing protein, partial [Escherichia coli]